MVTFVWRRRSCGRPPHIFLITWALTTSHWLAGKLVCRPGRKYTPCWLPYCDQELGNESSRCWYVLFQACLMTPFQYLSWLSVIFVSRNYCHCKAGKEIPSLMGYFSFFPLMHLKLLHKVLVFLTYSTKGELVTESCYCNCETAS